MSRKAWRCTAAVVVALGLVATACGDDSGGDSGAADHVGESGTVSGGKQPQPGGAITMGMFSETAGLDPIVSTGSGVTGAIEMLTIYDSVMRWNPETGKYEPRTAESLTSPDNIVWTLKLKPGIKFSDGTDYDAEAVKLSLDRHRSGLAGAPSCETIRACPRNTTSSAGYMSSVRDVQVIDKQTLQITLSDAWSEFPWVLADEPGMVPSPTALKAACPEDKAKSPRECSFNLAPVGAGPFVIDSFKPKDSITVKRNPSYWGGTVYLDSIRFINLGDGGSEKTLEALKANTVQVAFLRDPATVAKAKDDKYPGFSAVQQAGSVTLMNMGLKVSCTGGKPEPICTNKPDGSFETSPATKSLKVRQAVAAALDVNVISARAYEGKGRAGTELFQKDYRYYPNVPGPKFDLELAKRLVVDAKAEGWDGRLRYLCNNSPAGQNRALAYESLLKAAGIDVLVDVTKDITGQVNQYIVLRDFDLTCSGFPQSNDGNAFASMIQQFTPGGASNRTGWSNPIVADALKAFKAANTDDGKRAALKTISEQYVKDVPFVVDAAIEEYIAYNSKVRGLLQTSGTEIYFDKAYMEK